MAKQIDWKKEALQLRRLNAQLVGALRQATAELGNVMNQVDETEMQDSFGGMERAAKRAKRVLDKCKRLDTTSSESKEG